MSDSPAYSEVFEALMKLTKRHLTFTCRGETRLLLRELCSTPSVILHIQVSNK